jgi:hypothetical protein
MKINLFLFSCFVLLVSPFMVAQAADDQSLDQPEAEMTRAERSAFEKSLFEGRCQMCHQLPEPSMLRPKQWRLILTTMQQRMQQAGVPPLTEEETEMILEYIAEQSR